ncbi:MAG: hypothetical protein ACI9T9_000753 [Oleiphilaceae bacterium]|jgi:hypothetical protein
MISQKISALLTANSSINDAVANNHYLGEAPQETPRPYIVYKFENATPIKTFSGVSNLNAETWSVRITGEDLVAMDAIRVDVIAAFTAERAAFTASFDDINIEQDNEADLEYITLYFKIHYY